MATASEVKAGLDDIAATIRGERQALKQIVARASASVSSLDGLPTQYADLITTIDGYASDTTDEFEALAKAEKAKLAAEFTALKTKATTAKTALDAIEGLVFVSPTEPETPQP